MGRPVVLGNGSLTVGLNEHGLVHDFYYPYVGLDNLTTARSVHHLIGIWIDNKFSWVDDGSWAINVDFDNDAMISLVTMESASLQVRLVMEDFVDSEFDVFCRRITVSNQADSQREVRVFMHQVFQISRAGRADTALFVPDDNYLLDYKGHCALLIYGQDEIGRPFDQYAVGNYGIEGKEGTFCDATDGQLSGSAVEHGGVDSVMRFTCQLEPNSSMVLDYWIVASDSQYNAEEIHTVIKQDGLLKRKNATWNYWHEWLSTGANGLHLIDSKYVNPVKKSLMIIKVHCDKRGGVIASTDSSIYNYGRDYYSYVWPRDGAFALWPLIRLGYSQEAKQFFEFCRDILTPRGYLMHKYQPDRAIGSTWHPWLHNNRKELPIQEDETASVVYMLGEYAQYIDDPEFIKSMYQPFIQPAANFMANFIDDQTHLPHASYDLWEEKFLTSTYTTAVVYQALLVSADFADKYGDQNEANNWRAAASTILKGSMVFFDPERLAYRKGFLLQPDGSLNFDNTLDISSLYGVMMYGLRESSECLQASVELAEKLLLDQSPSQGSPRYENDRYFETDQNYMGNPWFVTTLWLAQYYARTKQPDKANHYIDWALANSLPSGVLAEQINPVNGQATSVAPLVWSHAELVNTILDVTPQQ